MTAPNRATDDGLTIIGLIVIAMRGWIAASESCSEVERGAGAGGAYSVFYIDAARPHAITMQGAAADRCELWVEPSDVRTAQGGVDLLVDVKIAHRRDGERAVIQFQIAFDQDMTPLIH